MEDLCAQSGLIAVPWLTQVEGTEAAVLGPLGNKLDSPARLVFPPSSLTLANSQFYQASKNLFFFPLLEGLLSSFLTPDMLSYPVTL